ncbi:MAG TPA: phosphoribosylformylglycinamidine synthase I [Planctomycetota bacterium]|nr:phosphoribosylformylglycinamidine synthase I [Planctomycetota bacterium]
MVRAAVLRCAGTNCERETVLALERAGARADLLHVREVYGSPERLRAYGIVVFPGGFSYGDHVGAGKIQALETRLHLFDALHSLAERGGIVLGICNGFQVLAKCGLLPGLRRGAVETTLAANDSGRYEDRWVRLRVEDSRATWLPKGLVLETPTAHGEGKFLARDAPALEAIERERLVAFRYLGPSGETAVYPWNPNGSQNGIAGLCDPSGRILGLMPHPDRNTLFHHAPDWTRRSERGEGAGAVLFRALVAAARG